MSELVEGWPVWAVFAAFWLIALLRSNATYWAGRGLRAGGERSRLAERLDRPAVVRTEALVRRFGAPAVVLSFLTVGVQTLINAAAGALRMPLARYLPASALGSVLWATLYTSVGVALWEAVTGGRWWWLLVPVAVAGLVVGVTRWAQQRVPSGR
ncbi:SNARE associated Golgi protein [Knoellia remsis]|uniref:SNARE associated Golgi protein n=1 Tax=Knoellia remsis TaxID=407159 RepID=A0A2T0UTQ6_9MICO|nr:VTT domain-containing protein [Knoellia remsis]PRY61311.1 SNARE associated Golgi protein [Knoellia remsis]